MKVEVSLGGRSRRWRSLWIAVVVGVEVVEADDGVAAKATRRAARREPTKPARPARR